MRCKYYTLIDTDGSQLNTPVYNGTDEGFQPMGPGTGVIPWPRLDDMVKEADNSKAFLALTERLSHMATEDGAITELEGKQDATANMLVAARTNDELQDLCIFLENVVRYKENPRLCTFFGSELAHLDEVFENEIIWAETQFIPNEETHMEDRNYCLYDSNGTFIAEAGPEVLELLPTYVKEQATEDGSYRGCLYIPNLRNSGVFVLTYIE